ncbi:hypothetical protein DTL42_23665 [Bremerella cremea]|uniref:MAE-28990/MAE-18760-like HEPN domain-containing protein n=1 Tax=Bremerella cremea TaxID=1031537 RepID=A0A368KNI0_9BACT|nr:MAE_28990/MAE_18760 family HEPN-like nuclease [Bremerella cremea]RCS41545.1 hypothetical protein DTL42_23665 [Bremerella cremea]
MNQWERDLEQDLNWREAEIATLKVLVTESPRGSTRERALLRALWALLYAHYEGFCKFAWDTYLDHLQASSTMRGECTDNIARFSLSASFRSLRGNLSVDSLWEYCTKEFRNAMSQPIEFEDRLETDSNLWPNICRENCLAIDLPLPSVDLHRAKIKALVSRRNDIAHGQPMTIETLDEYKKYEHAVFDVMYELALAVDAGLADRKYLRQSPN